MPSSWDDWHGIVILITYAHSAKDSTLFYHKRKGFIFVCMESYCSQLLCCFYSDKISGSPHLICGSLSTAMAAIQCPPLTDTIESVFIFGGERVFEVDLWHCSCSNCHWYSIVFYAGSNGVSSLWQTVHHGSVTGISIWCILSSDWYDPVFPHGVSI